MNTLPPTEQVHPTSAQLDAAPAHVFLEALLHDHRRVLDAVMSALPQIAALAESVAETYAAGGRVIFVGAGTSGRLAALEAAECPPTFSTDPERIIAVLAGGPSAMLHSSEGAEDDADAGGAAISALACTPTDLIIGVAASGSTPFVAGALRAAGACGTRTGAIVCNPDSPIAAVVDYPVVLETGPEFVAGSTRLKAGSAQKLALNMLTTGAMVSLGRIRAGRMIAVRATNSKLRARAIRTIEALLEVDHAAAAERLDQADGDLFSVLGDSRDITPGTEPELIAAALRPLAPSDLPALTTLAGDPAVVATTAPFARLAGEGYFGEWIARPGLMLGAFVDTELAGVIFAERRDALLREHVADITFVAVAPQHAGGGIGTQLVAQCLAWAEEQELTRVELRVWPDNARAIRLYSRMGFAIEGRMRGHAIVEGRVYDALLLAWVAPRLIAAQREWEEGHR